jgi:hypothetical protein
MNVDAFYADNVLDCPAIENLGRPGRDSRALRYRDRFAALCTNVLRH